MKWATKMKCIVTPASGAGGGGAKAGEGFAGKHFFKKPAY